MELKFDHLIPSHICQLSSNRTFMELKFRMNFLGEIGEKAF